MSNRRDELYPFRDDFTQWWGGGNSVVDDLSPDSTFPRQNHMHHVMQMYLLPSPNDEVSPWRMAGFALLIVTILLASMVILYYCVMRCFASKVPVTDEENPEEEPSSVCGENPGCQSELPSGGLPEKQQPSRGVSFRDSPSLNVSQPYQPEPEDLARMQEQMLAQLEATNQDWEIGHGDFDTKPLY